MYRGGCFKCEIKKKLLKCGTVDAFAVKLLSVFFFFFANVSKAAASKKSAGQWFWIIHSTAQKSALGVGKLLGTTNRPQ